VFVVGVPRSGTTALRNTLERHSSFAPRQRGSAETRVFERPVRILHVLEPEGAPLLEFLLDDREAAAEMLEQARAVRPSFLARLSPDAFLRAGHDHLVRVYLHHARRARGVQRLLEKTPAHALHLREIRLTYPEARVLACVRHPVDVYSSYRKRLSRALERDRYREGLDWLEADPAEFTRSYRESVDAILAALSAEPERVHLVAYEALTADPEAELARICAFLHEPFERGPLLEDVEVRRDEHGSPRLRSRIAPNEKDWRAFLPEDEAAAVENALAGAMERLGYRRYSSGGVGTAEAAG